MVLIEMISKWRHNGTFLEAMGRDTSEAVEFRYY
jgi:hypothetical protein